jgi:hypothetical protein
MQKIRHLFVNILVIILSVAVWPASASGGFQISIGTFSGCGEVDAIRNDACVYTALFPGGAERKLYATSLNEDLAGETLRVKSESCGEVDDLRQDVCLYELVRSSGFVIEATTVQ